MKTYKKHLKSHINTISGKTYHEDKRASQIEDIFDRDIELLGNQYEDYSIECNLQFNPIAGYFFEISINDSETDFSEITTENINGRSKSEIVSGLKNSYSYLVEALESHIKYCESEMYFERQGNAAEYDNY